MNEGGYGARWSAFLPLSSMTGGAPQTRDEWMKKVEGGWPQLCRCVTADILIGKHWINREVFMREPVHLV